MFCGAFHDITAPVTDTTLDIGKLGSVVRRDRVKNDCRYFRGVV